MMHPQKVLQLFDSFLENGDATLNDRSLLHHCFADLRILCLLPLLGIGAFGEESSATKRGESATDPCTVYHLTVLGDGSGVGGETRGGPVIVVGQVESRLAIDAHLIIGVVLQAGDTSLELFLGGGHQREENNDEQSRQC